MATLMELLAKKAELDAKIEQIRQSELEDAIAKVRALIADFDLTAADVFPRGKGRKGKRGRPPKADKLKKVKGKKRKAKRGPRAKVAPKYRDPATGATWSGRGRTPRWLDGQKKEDFLI